MAQGGDIHLRCTLQVWLFLAVGSAFGLRFSRGCGGSFRGKGLGDIRGKGLKQASPFWHWLARLDRINRV